MLLRLLLRISSTTLKTKIPCISSLRLCRSSTLQQLQITNTAFRRPTTLPRFSMLNKRISRIGATSSSQSTIERSSSNYQRCREDMECQPQSTYPKRSSTVNSTERIPPILSHDIHEEGQHSWRSLWSYIESTGVSVQQEASKER
jgi:hypothetical protein